MVLDRMKKNWDLEVIDGSDHSLGLSKFADRTQDEVYAHVLGRMVDWVKTKCKGEESDDNPQRSGQTRNTNPAG
jgi:hypothetical protein